MDSSPHRSADADRQRECRVLRERGLSAEQIATKLGLPISDVNRYLAPDRMILNIARDYSPPQRSGYKKSYGVAKYLREMRARRGEGVSKESENEYSLFDSKYRLNFGAIDGFKFISPIDYRSAVNLSFREKLELIEQNYRPLGKNVPIGEALRALFPGIDDALREESTATVHLSPEVTLSIPSEAPKQWSIIDESGEVGRKTGENPAEFVLRVYEPWLGKGMTRSHLHDLDPKLYRAFKTWVGRHGEPDFDLPTKKKLNDQWVVRVGQDVDASAQMREMTRQASVLRRRISKN